MAKQNISKANEILIDLVLEVMPINQPFVIWGNLYGKIMSDIHNKGFDEKLINNIRTLIGNNDEASRPFLLKNGYVKPIDHSTHKDISTEKGEKAKGLGGIKNI